MCITNLILALQCRGWMGWRNLSKTVEKSSSSPRAVGVGARSDVKNVWVLHRNKNITSVEISNIPTVGQSNISLQSPTTTNTTIAGHGRSQQKWPPSAPHEALRSAPMHLMDGWQPPKEAGIFLGGVEGVYGPQTLQCCGDDRSSICHRTVIWVPPLSMFTMHWSYGFTSKPIFFSSHFSSSHRGHFEGVNTTLSSLFSQYGTFCTSWDLSLPWTG